MDFELLKRIKRDSAISPSSRKPRAMHDDIRALINMVEEVPVEGLKPRTIERALTYDAIDGERDFQDKREGGIESNGDPGDGARTQHEYILYVEEWTKRLRDSAFSVPRRDIQASFRKVAALCVAAMEEHGSPRR